MSIKEKIAQIENGDVPNDEYVLFEDFYPLKK